LVFVTGLGFVLDGNPSAQHAVLNSALKDIPIVGDQIKAGSLTGSPTALVIGLVGAILSGLGVTLAAQTAFQRVHGVPHRKRPDFLFSRLRGLGLLGGPLLMVAGIAVSLATNLVLFTAAFRLLTDAEVETHQLWPGIASATVLWTIVQAVGGAYIGHVVKGAGATYGTFATVIGLLTWIFLGARIVVYSAELNSVLALRLWPRGLFEPMEPADRRALRDLARIEERSDAQHVSVSFDDDRRPERPDPPRAT
jgi:uncharacterized BrkB/YihY/UPF0761 family membrane protein